MPSLWPARFRRHCHSKEASATPRPATRMSLTRRSDRTATGRTKPASLSCPAAGTRWLQWSASRRTASSTVKRQAGPAAVTTSETDARPRPIQRPHAGWLASASAHRPGVDTGRFSKRAARKGSLASRARAASSALGGGELQPARQMAAKRTRLRDAGKSRRESGSRPSGTERSSERRLAAWAGSAPGIAEMLPARPPTPQLHQAGNASAPARRCGPGRRKLLSCFQHGERGQATSDAL